MSRSEIRHLEFYEKFLSDEELIIRIDRNRHYGFEEESIELLPDYGFEEESIELLPEEEEALKSIREAYRTILLTANNRKLEQARSEFEKL